jgi:hypothetical protein
VTLSSREVTLWAMAMLSSTVRIVLRGDNHDGSPFRICQVVIAEG